MFGVYAEAQQDDIGQNFVRIGTPWMKQIGVRPGEFVEIEGNRKNTISTNKTKNRKIKVHKRRRT